MNIHLPYGDEVILEVKNRSNLLPALYPSEPKTVSYRGRLEKPAAYDERDSVRLICKGQVTVRVIPLREITHLNGSPFTYSPTPTKSIPAAPKIIEVSGSKGKIYQLKISSFGKISCTCPGFGFRGKCHHIDDYLTEHGR